MHPERTRHLLQGPNSTTPYGKSSWKSAGNMNSKIMIVIISGLPESDGENLTQLVSGLVPEVNPIAITVRRIGKPLENKPRLVHVRTDPGTKARLLKHRFGLKHDTHSIYINHDLTRQQKDTRRLALPTFKQIRAKGIRCTLPLDIILVEGKLVSQQDIQRLLSANSSA